MPALGIDPYKKWRVLALWESSEEAHLPFLREQSVTLDNSSRFDLVTMEQMDLSAVHRWLV